MKTWEMIKELTENPEKEFISLDAYGDEMKAYIAEKFKDGNVSSSNVVVIEFEERTEIITLNGFMLKSKWEEVKKPVDFMTAIEALNGGKIIYVIRTDGYREIFNPAGKQTDWGVEVKQSQGYAVNTETILYGKWYIED